jgi:hypothetical protein
MRNTRCAVLTALIIVAFAAMAWSQATPATSSNAAPESQVGVVVIQEAVLIPLIDEPEHHFHLASKDFARGDHAQAADEIRIGASLIRIEAARNAAANKTGLEEAAKNLDDLADEVAKGTVKSQKPLHEAFAGADLALARHYHEMAEAAGQHNESKAGHWLKGAADSIDDAAQWSGQKLAAGGKATVNGARTLGTKIESGAKWSGDEVKKSVDALGNEIQKLGGGK